MTAQRKPKVLVAGATGYLGTHIVQELISRDIPFIAMGRNKQKLLDMGVPKSSVCVADVCNIKTFSGVMEGVDVVISCVGKTRQKDRLKYMDVDYQANSNILAEAKRARVLKFIYISAYGAQANQQVRMLKAKERFAQELLSSRGIEPLVIRPTGFFSDMSEFFNMAESGRINLFSDGTVRTNPIHGRDLAKVCVDEIWGNRKEVDVGGPEVLSLNQIAYAAFKSQHRMGSIKYYPDVMRFGLLGLSKILPQWHSGVSEFFLTMVGKDMIAPPYGEITLAQHFEEMYQEKSNIG